MMGKGEIIEVKNFESAEKTRERVWDELRSDFAEWMSANEDVVLRPAIELTKEDHEFAARALVPGVDSSDLSVFVTPERLLIKGEVHRGPFKERELLSSVKFPEAVDPATVHAEINDGMVSVRAEIAETAQTKFVMPMAA
jgi:HSP20 family molecular chaperone IbpA